MEVQNLNFTLKCVVYYVPIFKLIKEQDTY